MRIRTLFPQDFSIHLNKFFSILTSKMKILFYILLFLPLTHLLAQVDLGQHHSLNFEFVYYVLSPDYSTYMDTQHNINMKIFNKFKEEGIEFAYPTQLVYVNKSGSENTEK